MIYVEVVANLIDGLCPYIESEIVAFALQPAGSRFLKEPERLASVARK